MPYTTIDAMPSTYPATWEGLETCIREIDEGTQLVLEMLSKEVSMINSEGGIQQFTNIFGLRFQELVDKCEALANLINNYGQESATAGSTDTLRDDCKQDMQAVVDWQQMLSQAAFMNLSEPLLSLQQLLITAKGWF